MVSLPGDLYDRIKAIAEETDRPINWQVRIMLRRAVEEYERLKSDDQPSK